MIKGSIQEEDVTIVSIYAPNIGAPKYIKQILTDIKGEIDSNTIKVGNFKTPLIIMDMSSRQKINKETLALNDTLDQMEIYIYIYIAHSIQKQQNNLPFQVHTELSPGYITFKASKQPSVYLRKLKSYQVYFPSTML